MRRRSVFERATAGSDAPHVRRVVGAFDLRRLDGYPHLAPVAHPYRWLAGEYEADERIVGLVEAELPHAVKARHRHHVERAERNASIRHHPAVLRPGPLRAYQRIDMAERIHACAMHSARAGSNLI